MIISRYHDSWSYSLLFLRSSEWHTVLYYKKTWGSLMWDKILRGKIRYFDTILHRIFQGVECIHLVEDSKERRKKDREGGRDAVK